MKKAITPLAFAAALCLLDCKATPSPQAGTPPVRVTTAASGSILPSIETSGSVSSLGKADVQATVDGKLESILVQEGQQVVVGQELASMDKGKLLLEQAQANADVASREAGLRLAEARYQDARTAVQARFIEMENAQASLATVQTEHDDLVRLQNTKKSLFAVGGISKSELERIATELAAAKNRLIQAQGNLAMQSIGLRDEDIVARGREVPADPAARKKLLVDLNTLTLLAEVEVARSALSAALAARDAVNLFLDESILRAPISGVISERFFDPGAMVTRNDAILRILDCSTVYLDCPVGEEDAQALSPNQKALVNLPNGAVINGRLAIIAPVVNPESHSIKVRIALPNSAGRLRPGMFLKASIFTGAKATGTQVPASAVQEKPGQAALVYLLRDACLYRTAVSVQVRKEDIILVSGLEAGARIAVDASIEWADGQAVEVLE